MPNQLAEPTPILNDLEFTQFKANLFDTPEAIDMKIQLIKEEIEAGRYQVNSHHIAAKLQEFAPVSECLVCE